MPEFVPCANSYTDVEMGFAHATAEKWYEILCGLAALGIGIDHSQHPEVVSCESKRRVDGALLRTGSI